MRWIAYIDTRNLDCNIGYSMSQLDKYTTAAELEAYYALVDKFSRLQLNEHISNGKPEHAVYLISKLFDIATRSVRLYSDHLEHNVSVASGKTIDLYGDQQVISHVKRFLSEPGRRLEIVIENDVEKIEAHPLFKALNELESSNNILGRCEIRKISSTASNWLKDNQFINHFMVTDSIASRVEIEDDPTSYKAQANFGNKKEALKLASLFDNVHWKYADLIRSWG